MKTWWEQRIDEIVLAGEITNWAPGCDEMWKAMGFRKIEGRWIDKDNFEVFVNHKTGGSYGVSHWNSGFICHGDRVSILVSHLSRRKMDRGTSDGRT